MEAVPKRGPSCGSATASQSVLPSQTNRAPMTSPDTTAADISSSSPDTSHRLAVVRMPIEGPIEDIADAVQKLQTCDSTTLRRARQHHRRALESLANGGYSGLSEATRDHLEDRLRTNLTALNHVLDTAEPDTSADDASPAPQEPNSFSSCFRAFFQSLW